MVRTDHLLSRDYCSRIFRARGIYLQRDRRVLGLQSFHELSGNEFVLASVFRVCYLPANKNAGTLPESTTRSSRVFRFFTFSANSPVLVRSSLTANAALSS